MITVEEAKRIMMEQVRLTPSGSTRLDHAIGQVLSEDVTAQHSFPLFDMSAVDGYAFSGEGPSWKVVASIAAGEVFERILLPGECVRIFTGAQVPAGTYTVAMQERCTTADGVMRCDAIQAEGANIRRRAEGHQQGDPLFSRGQWVDAPMIGMIAADGHEKLMVCDKPRVGVVRTGGEFIEPGQDPAAGRIFSSNEWMLEAALIREGCSIGDGAWSAEDRLDKIGETIMDAAAVNEVIITTGGVSVGEHDLIRPVLEKLGAQIHFHGVAQKPGKPMLFATLSDTPVFGLPGNPRAVMVLFWEYVLPFLRAIRGAKDPWLKSDELPFTHAVNVKGDRAEFRPAIVKGGRVTLLKDEGSHMLRSLVGADALAYLPVGKRSWNEGGTVEIHYLTR